MSKMFAQKKIEQVKRKLNLIPEQGKKAFRLTLLRVTSIKLASFQSSVCLFCLASTTIYLQQTKTSSTNLHNFNFHVHFFVFLEK
jgi:hypothetical protein